jgi:hypothetical protein
MGCALTVVQPQAVRTTLDIYGENARKIVPIDSPQFGRVMAVCIGAMMVGSIHTTKAEGEQVKRGEEFGYFAFGAFVALCALVSHSSPCFRRLDDRLALREGHGRVGRGPDHQREGDTRDARARGHGRRTRPATLARRTQMSDPWDIDGLAAWDSTRIIS